MNWLMLLAGEHKAGVATAFVGLSQAPPRPPRHIWNFMCTAGHRDLGTGHRGGQREPARLSWGTGRGWRGGGQRPQDIQFPGRAPAMFSPFTVVSSKAYNFSGLLQAPYLH